MKLTAIFIFLFIPFFPSEAIDVKIEWSESKKLTWSDFRGPRTKDASYAASTSSGISFTYSVKHAKGDIDLDFSVKCHFYPEKSWYDRNHASEYILKHEQTHFDISELHARVLRKLISEAEFSKDIKTEIKAIYQEVERQRGKMQRRFDTETEHSINKKNEYLWEAFIANQLIAYERWK
jgi:hypothetical protein